MKEENIVLGVLLWLNGALVGAFVCAIYTYYQLATGRRTVKPWPVQESPDEP